MLIEIWSDVVCPWCYIGKRRLEAALADFPHADEVEVVYRSFELDPSAPAAGSVPMLEALGRKYGGGLPQARAMLARMTEAAADEGLTFDYADVLHTGTTAAHRLLHLALAEAGPEGQRTLKEALLSAYFTHGRSMGDHAVLRDVATASGLDPHRVEEVLAGEEYADAVEADLAQARAYGISGVPFFVLDRRVGVSGAQPAEVLGQVLRQVWDDAHPQLQVLADGTVCGPDGCAV